MLRDLLNVESLSAADQFKTKVRELGKEGCKAYKILMSESIDNIIKSIKDGSPVGVSNGHFKLKFGTACWIIEDGAGTERIIGLIDVPGTSDEHDAYRSEMAGLYGIGKAVNILEAIGKIEVGKIEVGKIEVGCDGLSALNRCFKAGHDEIS